MGSTTQNEVTNALTAAMKIMADSSAQSKLATLTVEAEVTAIVDKGNGIYKVSYLGSAFEATAANTETTYEIGDMVYVIIPNGDFEKNKIILSSSKTVTSTIYAEAGEDDFCNTTDNLLYEFNEELSVRSTKINDEDSLSYNNEDYIYSYSNLMRDVLNSTRTLKVKCNLRTNILEMNRNTGNYGIKIAIGGAKHSETNVKGYETYSQYEHVFDIADILGDPYNLSTPSPQTFTLTVPEDFYIPVNTNIYLNNGETLPFIKITLYSCNFSMSVDDSEAASSSLLEDDIFASSIQVYGLTPAGVGEGELGYYSVLSASEGNYFEEDSSDFKILTISAYLNQKAVNINYFDCYWFYEDYRVVEGEPGYHKYGGNGWRIMNDYSQTESTNFSTEVEKQYITNQYEWKVYRPFSSQKYKCVLVKNNIVLNSTIVLINNKENDGFSFNIKNANGVTVNTFSNKLQNDPIYFEIKANKPEDDYYSSKGVSFCLQLINSKGEFIGNDDFYTTLLGANVLLPQEDAESNLLYSVCSFYPYQLDEGKYTLACSVFVYNHNDEGSNIIYNKAITFTIDNSYITIQTKVVDGNKTFLYNKYGIYEKTERWLKNKIHQDFGKNILLNQTRLDVGEAEEGFITALPGGEEEPIKIFLYKNNGLEFTPAEYSALTFEWSFYSDSLFLGGIGTKKENKEGDSYLTNFSFNDFYGHTVFARTVISNVYAFPYKYDTSNGLITIIKGKDYKEEEVNLYPEQVKEFLIDIPSYYEFYSNCNNIFPYGVKKYYKESANSSSNKIFVKIKGPEYLVGPEGTSLEIPFTFKKESNPNGFSKKNYFKIIVEGDYYNGRLS